MREIDRERERERDRERGRERKEEREREREKEIEKKRERQRKSESTHWSVFLHISPITYFFTAACENKLDEKTLFHGDSLFIHIMYLWVDLSFLTRQELYRQCQYWQWCECM